MQLRKTHIRRAAAPLLSLAALTGITGCGLQLSMRNKLSAGATAKVIPLRADVDGDCKVTIADLQRIRAARGQTAGFDPKLDLNRDGSVDLVDSALAIAAFGKTCDDLRGRGEFKLYSNAPYDEQIAAAGYGALWLGHNGYIYRGNYPVYDETVGYEPAVRAWVPQIAAAKRAYGVVDVEQWSFGDADFASTVQKLTDILSWFQDQRAVLGLGASPGVGLYGNVPQGNFWAPNNYLGQKNFVDLLDQGYSADDLQKLGVACPNTTAWCRANVVPGGSSEVAYRQWLAFNDRLAPLANKADALFPSLYLFYEPSEGMLWSWVFYLRSQIQESARYRTGKPVLPYVWPQIHNSTRTFTPDPREGWYLPRYVWAFLLETVYLENGATGLVIWDDTGSWDAQKSYGWWQATQEWQRFYGLPQSK